MYIYILYGTTKNFLEQHVLLWARFSGYATPIYIDKAGKIRIIMYQHPANAGPPVLSLFINHCKAI